MPGFVLCVPRASAAGGTGHAPGTVSLQQRSLDAAHPRHGALLCGRDCASWGPRPGRALASTLSADRWESGELGRSAAASPGKLLERQTAACSARVPLREEEGEVKGSRGEEATAGCASALGEVSAR